ncbi:MAG: hypothetical protein LUD17_05230 [Bacteroidales bacterium]|nr:hypothetical protein [Bacteroidales bacterium]
MAKVKYILSGEESEVAKVLQENRIRQEWGLIHIEPYAEPEQPNAAEGDAATPSEQVSEMTVEADDFLEPDPMEDAKESEVSDTKQVELADEKKPKSSKKKKSE